MLTALRSRRDGGVELDVRVWDFDRTMLCASSASAGGGVGPRRWVLNAQVRDDYARTDLADHVQEMADALGLAGQGVGLLTAALVRRACFAQEDGVAADATVGLTHPTWAAQDDAAPVTSVAGTINVVTYVPVRLDEAALINAVVSATEAKSQALFDAAVPGTGTPSDAICVVCPLEGDAERFAGPRSPWGSRLARVVYRAVLDGART